MAEDMHKSDATARMNRRKALIAAAKEKFERLDSRERDVLSYGVQTAHDQAQTVLRLSRGSGSASR